MIGGQSKTNITKTEILQITAVFSNNIFFGSQNEKNGRGNKCVNIYKNLLSDIRIFFNNQYNNFLKTKDINTGHNLVQLPLYPILIREFIKQTFNPEIMQIFKQLIPNFKIQKFYFEFAAFL